MKKILISMVIVACLLWAGSVFAVPTLQLDISGGVYDDTPGVENVVSTGDIFTLYALLNRPDDYSGDFYISAAVTPQVSQADDLGSFSFDGTIYDVTDDMIFGTPPELAPDNKDLSSHSIFETFYHEFKFSFDGQKAALYNVEDNPGGTSPWTGGDYLYYKAFQVDVSGLDAGYEIHFDLYSVKWDDNKDQLIVDDFAPFSHDAQSGGGTPVPEPSTLLLLGAGLAGFGAYHRRRGKG